MEEKDKCPTCNSPLGEITETANGRKLRRCSAGTWNKDIRQTDGCAFVKWLPFEQEKLDEKCPECGSPLVIQMTRFGKKMKKCSAGGWDKETKKPTGCPYVEWINGTTEKLDEICPECGKPLVLFTTTSGKKMKKCSTAGWDREAKKATGCTYVEWLKYVPKEENTGEEFLPPEPEEEK
ncbi:topoisomerase DNA-binding C4 zinc finger domain-containing protein [Patescibacteria group bacterium]|nr:topoisomerase DNA-binding C4 zinc finger domain-containing protein [Patescibacteria group bacterium]